jgi:NADH-quinone oxidoreductase subunit C
MSSTSSTAPAPIDLVSKFPAATARASNDIPAFNVPQENLLAALSWLRNEQGFDMLVDVTAIDWQNTSPRFEVIYHLYSTREHRYLRIATACADDASPAVPTVESLWPAANWHERETYDMFGIRFTNHSDLRRILMWDEYPYFPLRKEFPLAGIEVPLPGADIAEETGVSAKPAPMMGGPFVAPQAGGVMSEAEPRAKDESWTERTEKPVI